MPGLRPGVDRQTLAAAIGRGTLSGLPARLPPSVGRLHLLAGRHGPRLGAGLLVAEIQQSSDVTFRLFDWNRVGPDGKPRTLHVEQGRRRSTSTGTRGTAAAAGDRAAGSEPAGRSASKFVLDRWEFDAPLAAAATIVSTLSWSSRGPCGSRAIRPLPCCRGAGPPCCRPLWVPSN